MVTVITIVIIALALFAWFLWGNKSKPAVIDQKQAAGYQQLLLDHVAYYQKLNDAAKLQFEQRVEAFISETHIEGVGTEIDDVDRILIASSAVIPVFGFPNGATRT